MKKIISIFLALAIMFLCCFSVSANTVYSGLVFGASSNYYIRIPKTANFYNLTRTDEFLKFDSNYNITTASFDGGLYQQWTFTCVENDIYRIKNVRIGNQSPVYLAPVNGSTDIGTAVSLNGTSEKRWKLYKQDQFTKYKLQLITSNADRYLGYSETQGLFLTTENNAFVFSFEQSELKGGLCGGVDGFDARGEYFFGSSLIDNLQLKNDLETLFPGEIDYTAKLHKYHITRNVQKGSVAIIGSHGDRESLEIYENANCETINTSTFYTYNFESYLYDNYNVSPMDLAKIHPFANTRLMVFLTCEGAKNDNGNHNNIANFFHFYGVKTSLAFKGKIDWYEDEVWITNFIASLKNGESVATAADRATEAFFRRYGYYGGHETWHIYGSSSQIFVN